MHDVDQRALDAAVEQARPRLAIVQIALTAGPFLFLAVVVLLSLTHEVADAQEVVPPFDLLDLLSLIHVGVALVMLPLALLVMPRLLLGQAARGTSRLGAVARLVGSLQAVCIVRLALAESAALFGILIVMLAVLQGALAERPIYWANTASCLVLLAVSVATFPTRDRLQDLVRRALSKA